MDDEALRQQQQVQVQRQETTGHALVQKAGALRQSECFMVEGKRVPGVGLNPNMQQQTQGSNQQPSGTATPSSPANAQAILPMLKVLLEQKQKEELEALRKQQQEQQERLQRRQQELLLPLLSLGQQGQGRHFALGSGHAGILQRLHSGAQQQQQQPSLAAFKPLSVAPAPLDNGLSFLLQNIPQGVGSVTPSNREPPVSSGSVGGMVAHAQPTGANSSTSQGFSTAGAAFQGSEASKSGYADSDDDRKPPAEKRQRR